MSILTKQRFKLALLIVLQITVVISPLVGLLIFKRSDYFKTPEKIYSLSFSCVVCLTFIILQALGKTPKNLHKLIKLALLSVFLWVLRPVLYDLCLLVTACFVGELLGFLIFSHFIKVQRLKVTSLETLKVENELQKACENVNEWSGRV